MSEVFDDAVKAYAKYCEKNNFIFSQPSESLSDQDDKFVHLSNTNGDLARYEIESGQVLLP